jgi:hypothetical protein
MDNLISGMCGGAGIVLFCESEYTSLKLFKRRRSLFFSLCQLAIWSNSLETLLTILLSLSPNLRVLPMLVIFMITFFVQNMSYPIMMLLRLRFVYDFPVIIMYIPAVLSAALTVLEYFWIRWVLTGAEYDFNASFIVQLITTILLTVEYILINIFFIVIAIKYFQSVVHVRCVIIVNIIVIGFECIAALVQFLTINDWITLSVAAIVSQIIVRLELEILSYIIQSTEAARERRMSDEDQSETRNKFCHAFDFILWQSRVAGLT